MENCYKVVVRFKEQTDTELPTSITYEVMAKDPAEAEDLTIKLHRKEWEKTHTFDCIKTVFPCDD